LYNGKAAEQVIKSISDLRNNWKDNDLIKHNMVVFCNGENALKHLPPLVDFCSEARSNLVIYYLRNDFDDIFNFGHLNQFEFGFT
jgi:intraflagellar transport protein 56